MVSDGHALWVDDGLVQPGSLAIDPRDRGFTLGDGLFETMLVRRGRVLASRHHFARLRAGADLLALRLPWTDDDLAAALRATIAAAGQSDAVARLTVSRGVPRARGLLFDADATPTLVIHVQPYAGVPAELATRGARVVTSAIPRNERSPLARAKTLSYLDNVLARQEAASRGADEALLRNTVGTIACASAGNLFLLRGETLVTPDLASGALAGTRRQILVDTVAGKIGLHVEERPVHPDELNQADEVFLTNALIGVLPVVEVDGQALRHPLRGSVTRVLQDALAEVLDEG